MLDVLHYILDDDLTFVMSEEHAKVRSSVRETLYKSIYNQKYKYSLNDNSNGYNLSDDNLVATGNARSEEVKPYFPPTPFNPDSPNPFGGALRETPLG